MTKELYGFKDKTNDLRKNTITFQKTSKLELSERQQLIIIKN